MNNKRYTKNISDKQIYCGYEIEDCKYQQIYGFKDYNDLEEFVDCDLTLAIDKLGVFEDLEEKYKIPNMRYLENCIIKHDKYGELEEQLGCPLDVLFKAIQKGIYYEDVANHMQFLAINLDFDSNNNYTLCYYDEEYLLVKDYKKTWWLKKDKSE